MSPLYNGNRIMFASFVVLFTSILLMCICSALASWIPVRGETLRWYLTGYWLLIPVMFYFGCVLASTNTWFFRCINPHFNVLMGFYHLYNGGTIPTYNPWSLTEDGAFVDVLFILFHIGLTSWLLYALEQGVFKRKKASTANVEWDSDITEFNRIDMDVLEEEKLAMADSTAPLCLKVARKMYRRGRCIALRSASFTVKRGECFGLLGLNGAGKTTVMNIAAGLLAPSEGSALLRGVNPVENPSIIAERLALNPQHDDLFPELTVRENIMFCAKLRGYAAGPALVVWTEK